MPRKLIIKLGNQPSEAAPAPAWLWWHDEGNSRSITLSEITKFSSLADNILVLVPGEDVFLTQVKLPRLSPYQLAKALPFALEDQLTEDSATLHFAVGIAPKGAPLPIAVVSKVKLQAWINLLLKELKGDYGKVQALIPETLAVPWETGNTSILLTQTIALARTDSQAGFAIEKDNLFPILKLHLKQSTRPKPQKIIVYGPEQTIFSKTQEIELGVPVVFHQENNPQALLAAGVNDKNYLNLLQGPYAPKQKKLTLEQLATLCFVVAIAWLALLTLTDFASYLILHRAHTKLNDGIQNIYQSVFPGQLAPENIKPSIEKELSRLQTINAGSTFLRLVNLSETPVAKMIQTGLVLKEANFTDNKLVLDIETRETDTLENLRKELESQGLKITVSNAERQANGMIETHLTIEEIS